MIFAGQIPDFLDDLSGRMIGRISRNRYGILQPSVAMLLICFAPAVVARPADPKKLAGFTVATHLPGVQQLTLAVYILCLGLCFSGT